MPLTSRPKRDATMVALAAVRRLVTGLFLLSLLALAAYMLTGLIAPERLPAGWTAKWSNLDWQPEEWRDFYLSLFTSAVVITFFVPLSGWVGARISQALLRRASLGLRPERILLVFLLLLPASVYGFLSSLILNPLFFVLGGLDSPLVRVLAFTAGNLVPTSCLIILVVTHFILRHAPDAIPTTSTTEDSEAMPLGVPDWLFRLCLIVAIAFTLIRLTGTFELMAVDHRGPQLDTLKDGLASIASGWGENGFGDYFLALIVGLPIAREVAGWFGFLLPKPVMATSKALATGTNIVPTSPITRQKSRGTEAAAAPAAAGQGRALWRVTRRVVTGLFLLGLIALAGYLLLGVFGPPEWRPVWKPHPFGPLREEELRKDLLTSTITLALWLPLSAWLGTELASGLARRAPNGTWAFKIIFVFLLAIPNYVYCILLLISLYPVIDYFDYFTAFKGTAFLVAAGNIIPTTCFIALILIPVARRLGPANMAEQPGPQGARANLNAPGRLFCRGMLTASLAGLVYLAVELALRMKDGYGPEFRTLEAAASYMATGMSDYFLLDYYLAIAIALPVAGEVVSWFPGTRRTSAPT